MFIFINYNSKDIIYNYINYPQIFHDILELCVTSLLLPISLTLFICLYWVNSLNLYSSTNSVIDLLIFIPNLPNNLLGNDLAILFSTESVVFDFKS